jgi:hypothetical protein
MSYTNADGIISFTLNSANPSQEINLSEIKCNIREFVIGQNSIFDGGGFKIQRFISNNTGYTDYILPTTGETFIFNFFGSGIGLGFFTIKGKIKFILENPGDATNITIDLLT